MRISAVVERSRLEGRLLRCQWEWNSEVGLDDRNRPVKPQLAIGCGIEEDTRGTQDGLPSRLLQLPGYATAGKVVPRRLPESGSRGAIPASMAPTRSETV